jgi:hypothetical protein
MAVHTAMEFGLGEAVKTPDGYLAVGRTSRSVTTSRSTTTLLVGQLTRAPLQLR